MERTSADRTKGDWNSSYPSAGSCRKTKLVPTHGNNKFGGMTNHLGICGNENADRLGKFHTKMDKVEPLIFKELTEDLFKVNAFVQAMWLASIIHARTVHSTNTCNFSFPVYFKIK